MKLALQRVKIPDKIQLGLDSVLTINGLKLSLQLIFLISVIIAVGYPMYLAFEFKPVPTEFRRVIVHHNLFGTSDTFKVCYKVDKNFL